MNLKISQNSFSSIRGVTIAKVPHGIKIDPDNEWVRSFYIRELNGYDEDFLNRLGVDFPAPLKTTELLARLLVCGISYSNNKKSLSELKIDSDLVIELTVGDRISLLLQSRRLVMGNNIGCEVNCPECKKLMSLDLKVSEILQPLEDDPKREYSTNIEGFNLELRPVNGKDQESLLILDRNIDILHYEDYIIRRCLVSSKPPLPDSLSRELVAKTSSKLDQIDPQAHLVLELKCPSCSIVFQTPFFHEDFIFQELSSRYHMIHQEVHLLAFYYHWSEEDILSLPIPNRKKYVELILQSMNGGESFT